MPKNRLEAFSDGVIAIAFTIMVLELKVPHEVTIESLLGVLPHFVGYALSFLYIAIYWNNHHHMLHTVRNVNGATLWANNHLLFWLTTETLSWPMRWAWIGRARCRWRATWPLLSYPLFRLCFRR